VDVIVSVDVTAYIYTVVSGIILQTDWILTCDYRVTLLCVFGFIAEFS